MSDCGHNDTAWIPEGKAWVLACFDCGRYLTVTDADMSGGSNE